LPGIAQWFARVFTSLDASPSLHLVTRDEQITAALELLAPPPRDRSECLHDINVTLDSID